MRVCLVCVFACGESRVNDFVPSMKVCLADVSAKGLLKSLQASVSARGWHRRVSAFVLSHGAKCASARVARDGRHWTHHHLTALCLALLHQYFFRSVENSVLQNVTIGSC